MDVALALVQHYQRHGAARGLPWRVPSCPVELQVLVEGLLYRTRAEQVAEHFPVAFAGVTTGSAWLALQPLDRLRRVSPLGHGRQKLAQVDRLAVALATATPRLLDPARHVDAMALLRWGHYGEPVDADLARIVGRMLPRVATEVWVADLVWQLRGNADPGPSMPTPAPPVSYQAVNAVLDLAATRCPSRGALGCGACPLRPGCATGRNLPVRLRLA